MTGITRPTGDQLRFNSSATGEHILDDYLEDAERGTKTLGELVDVLFDANGSLAVFKYRGAWAATTSYAQYDIVLESSNLYVCHTPHTSTGSFSGISQWVLATTAGQIDAAATVLNNRLTSTSITSLSVSAGAKSLTVATGEAFTVGQLIRVANSTANWMVGPVTSYDAATGALVFEATSFLGSGSLSSWTVTITGETGQPGQTKVSANDTTPATLVEKLVAGTGVVLQETNNGANETLVVTVPRINAVSFFLAS